MGDKKIVVPEGMALDACKAWDKSYFENHSQNDNIHAVLVAALRWLSDNPIEPDEDEVNMMFSSEPNAQVQRVARQACVEWQRRMFLAPDLDPSEDELRDLLHEDRWHKEIGDAIREAYRRGRKARP